MSAYFIAALALVLASDTAQVSVRVSPDVPHIERRDGQALNFDFVIENTGPDTLELTKVLTSPHRSWHPGANLLIFNPFR